ncbi:MAG: response regulator [Chthoniobacterales bacterium]|nr:response regulator [Chthoniobacterales bacterium]
MNQSTSTPSPLSSEQNSRVLVLAPDETLAARIRAALHEAAPQAQVDIARSLEEAQHIVVRQKPDLFVLDIDATYDLGQDFYDLRTSHPQARAIVLTAAHREQAAGLGAIHFLEKPFPHQDFVLLASALLHAGGEQEDKFQGTLSDLHIADIIQLKCMSGATSALEFTGPRGEKARVFFEKGQVRHATAPGKTGVDAFNEIVNWKGGMISEVSGTGESTRSIELDWQMLLLEAVRKIDEEGGDVTPAAGSEGSAPGKRRVLVIDDSVMLLNFVKEILVEANYEVVAAPTAAEGLAAAARQIPLLILLDYVLPDMKGDEVLTALIENAATRELPVVYMSGFGTDLPSDSSQNPNVIGSLNKPFTSDLLLKTVETYMPKEKPAVPPVAAAPSAETPSAAVEAPDAPMPENGGPSETASESTEAPPKSDDPSAENFVEAQPEVLPAEIATPPSSKASEDDGWWSAAPSAAAPWPEVELPTSAMSFQPEPPQPELSTVPQQANMPLPVEGAYFCGDTSFFSLNWALHTIASEKLTGTLRSFWNNEPVELLARAGQIILATTRDPQLYCSEAPITLVNIDEEKVEGARQQQRETGRPLFVSLAQEELIIREPAMQLVQHYGQKLFAQLWCAPRVRFIFEQSAELPSYTEGVPAEDDVDHWVLGTLRFIQHHELGTQADYDPASIPAYTRDGFDRVQRLRLTVAEAQFASQFNGSRSIAQIAKNLRLDLKFARLTLFRFLALEIVECWAPATVGAKPEKRGVFGRIFGE